MDQHRPEPSCLKEDHILERGAKGFGVLHGASTQLDHNQATAKPAEIAQGFNQNFGFARGFCGLHMVRPSGKNQPRSGGPIVN
jgi:hypothetical protein